MTAVVWVRSPQSRQAIFHTVPCSSSTSRDPARWCSPSFCVINASSRPKADLAGRRRTDRCADATRDSTDVSFDNDGVGAQLDATVLAEAVTESSELI